MESITKEEWKGLSIAGKALLGISFGMLRGTGTITYHMHDDGPGRSAEEGFIELIQKGFVDVQPFNRQGGVVLKANKLAPPNARLPSQADMKTVVIKRPLENPEEGAAITKRMLEARPVVSDAQS